MKNQSTRSRLLCSALALGLILALGSPVQSQAPQPAEGKMMMPVDMKEHCQAMKERKEQMKADMKTQDDELAALVARMNSAPADKKLDLLAAVVTTMVEQRTVRNARMEAMQSEMMTHMMGHMPMGKDSTTMCPMMMGMKSRPSSALGPNNDHQQKKK